MRTCRFKLGGRELYGEIRGSEVYPLSAEPWAGGLPDHHHHHLSDVTLIAPAQPSKVVCVGKNYRAHAKELGSEVPKEPLLFIKPSTAIIGPQSPIRYPEQSSEVHHEAELAVIVGRVLTRATPTQAKQAIFGFTCLNDVTARDIQREEKHFTRSKSFDTFCPIGPVIETDLDPTEVTIQCRVNGEQRQRGYAKDMVVDPYELLSFISNVMTLLPGDVVATGTPEGVGPIRRGDWVEVEVSGIGVLKNPVL